MIFGRWMPLGALGAGLVFGFARRLQQKLGILGTPIPSEFLSMLPYIVTIVVVPASSGEPPTCRRRPALHQAVAVDVGSAVVCSSPMTSRAKSGERNRADEQQ